MILNFGEWISVLAVFFLFGTLCLANIERIINEDLKKKKIEKFIYVVMAILLIIIVINLVMNNHRNKELTDEIIVQDLKIQDNQSFIIIGLLITMFGSCIIFIVQGIKELIKKKDKEMLKGAIETFVITCILGGILQGAMLSSYKIDTTYDKWYIATSEISKMEKSGRRAPDYYIYIEEENEKIKISSETYKQLSEGCVVYVVYDEDGKIRQVYSKEKYTYVGDKLNVSN